MTAYNAEKTIEKALRGGLDLENPASQIIVVDDCSSDTTAAILDEISRRDSRIVILSNSRNLGQSKSRNLGANFSKNEYLIFMDDDDVSLPKRAITHIEALESGSDISYVSTAKSYPNGYVVNHINSNFTNFSESSERIIRYLIIGEKHNNFENLFSPACALAVRRSSFLKIGGFREDMRRLEDIDFVCRSLESNLVINWSPAIGVLRFDTVGNDKNSEANAKGELSLLASFKHHFTPRERLVFQIMVSLRREYFSEHRQALLLSIFKAITLLILDCKRFVTIYQRFLHDYRKNKS